MINVSLDAVALDELALAILEAVAKLELSAGPLNFTTPVVERFGRPPEGLGLNEETPAFEAAMTPCCPYGGKYVGAGVDIDGGLL